MNKISISATNSYCPNCKKVVRTTRGEIDVPLAIFLFCCTGGIGFIIYIIIYFGKPEDRCVFCSQQTVPYTGQQVSNDSSNLYGKPQPNSSISSPNESKAPVNFCPNCGETVNESMKFCENCGTELEK